MNTCELHDGVMVFDGRKCPVCKELAQLADQVMEWQDRHKAAVLDLHDSEADVARLQALLDTIDEVAPEAGVLARLAHAN